MRRFQMEDVLSLGEPCPRPELANGPPRHNLCTDLRPVGLDAPRPTPEGDDVQSCSRVTMSSLASAVVHGMPPTGSSSRSEEISPKPASAPLFRFERTARSSAIRGAAQRIALDFPDSSAKNEIPATSSLNARTPEDRAREPGGPGRRPNRCRVGPTCWHPTTKYFDSVRERRPCRPHRPVA